ncbi:hypothetical protein [uncultured Rubinisphaera sp.]|uniref:hypothetical protein n=1 Tax=uncultured Rubinisphaera sp. TaxID=1678686 RepID=UPI000EE308BB|nr:hypothetical protein [Planctomycetaceae bacterium]
MKFTTRTTYYQLFTVLIFCLSLGCGAGDPGSASPSKNATVSGKVTSGGQPVTNAVISFEKPTFGAWGSEIGADGTYQVELAAGDFKVSVTPKVAATTNMEAGNVPQATERKDIPQKYRSASTSEVTTTINEGANTFDLELNE